MTNFCHAIKLFHQFYHLTDNLLSSNMMCPNSLLSNKRLISLPPYKLKNNHHNLKNTVEGNARIDLSLLEHWQCQQDWNHSLILLSKHPVIEIPVFALEKWLAHEIILHGRKCYYTGISTHTMSTTATLKFNNCWELNAEELSNKIYTGFI